MESNVKSIWLSDDGYEQLLNNLSELKPFSTVLNGLKDETRGKKRKVYAYFIDEHSLYLDFYKHNKLVDRRHLSDLKLKMLMDS